MTDLVLIDDDVLIHGTWMMVARLKKHHLSCFCTIEEFLDQKLPLNIPVYIDYHFQSGQNGSELSKKLYKQGYKNLYITTGSLMSVGQKPDEVIAVLDKNYPL